MTIVPVLFFGTGVSYTPGLCPSLDRAIFTVFSAASEAVDGQTGD